MIKEVKIIDKIASEKLQLINLLDVENKEALFKIFDTMLIKTKDFFQKKVAVL